MGQLGVPAISPPPGFGQHGPGVGQPAAADLTSAFVDPPFALFEGVEWKGGLRRDHTNSVARGCDNVTGPDVAPARSEGPTS